MLVIALYLPFVCLIAPSLGSVLKKGIKLVVGCLMMEKKWLVKIALKNKKKDGFVDIKTSFPSIIGILGFSFGITKTPDAFDS